MKKMIMALALTASCTLSVFAGDSLLTTSWRSWMLGTKHKAGCKVSIKDGTIKILTKSVEKQGDSHVQVYQNINLEKGKKYKLTFDLKTSVEGTIQLNYILGKKPWLTFSSTTLKISPDKTSYEMVFTPKAAGGKYENPGSLRFFMGKLPDAEMTMSNLVLTEVK